MLKNLSLLVFALTTIPYLSAAPVAPSPAEQQVIQANKARMTAAATRDLKAWSLYVADGCTFSDDNGQLLSKAQMLDHYRKLPAAFDRGLDPRDHVVHLYGETAILNYRATVHEQFGTTDIVSEQRRTETFLKIKDAWILIAIQWDNLPLNLRKPTATDPQKLKDYLGQYQWRDGDDIESVVINNGKLFSQIGTESEEYLPVGTDKFFLKDDLGSYTFIRDAQGHVTGYDYERTDGQIIHAIKIK